MGTVEATIHEVLNLLKDIVERKERTTRDAAETQFYRERLALVSAIAQNIAAHGGDTITQLLPVMNALGEAIGRYLGDLLAEDFENTALAPGAAASLLYTALDHLVNVTDDQYRWVQRSSSWLHSGHWSERYHRVAPSNYDTHLVELLQALGDVAGAAREAGNKLYGVNRLSSRALALFAHLAAPGATQDHGEEPTTRPEPRTVPNPMASAPVRSLRQPYIELLADIRTSAVEIRQALKRGAHPLDLYTARDQVRKTVAMIRQMERKVVMLRMSIISDGDSSGEAETA